MKSIILELTSADMTNAYFAVPAFKNLSAVLKPKMNPAHAVEISYAQAFSACKFLCTNAAVDGAKPSGVNVVTMISPISAGAIAV